MTPTPTPDLLDAFRNDLQRVAFHLDAHSAAVRRGLTDEAAHHYGEATDLVGELSNVVAAWAEDARRRPTPPPAAVDDEEPLAPIVELPHLPPLEEVGDAVNDAATVIADAVTEAPAPPRPTRLACDWEGCTESCSTPTKLAAHKRKHARDQLQADAHSLRVEAEAREATKKAAAAKPTDPAPPREMQGTTTTVGVYEVKTIGNRRFIRCPETLCGKRVSLTDEETQFEIADTLDGHQRSPDCGARVAAAKRR